MKKYIITRSVFVIVFSIMFNSLTAQTSSVKFQDEIKEALNRWNTACKNAELDKVMEMFDNSASIMLVGSADGEISKGKDEIREWLSQMFGLAGFSWEMNRTDIDCNGKTAWVFMEGKMVVDFHKGGRKVIPYRFTGIIVQEKGIWKWRLFDGSEPKSE